MHGSKIFYRPQVSQQTSWDLPQVGLGAVGDDDLEPELSLAREKKKRTQLQAARALDNVHTTGAFPNNP